jgi:hypothetical protein
MGAGGTIKGLRALRTLPRAPLLTLFALMVLGGALKEMRIDLQSSRTARRERAPLSALHGRVPQGGRRWKSRICHSWVPFYMGGSLKAAVDLKP